MTVQASWPRVYRVTLRSMETEGRSYDALTWLDSAKAVAMATAEFMRADPAGHPPYEVTVEDLGPAPRSEDGTVGVPRGALFDRREF